MTIAAAIDAIAELAVQIQLRMVMLTSFPMLGVALLSAATGRTSAFALIANNGAPGRRGNKRTRCAVGCKGCVEPPREEKRPSAFFYRSSIRVVLFGRHRY